MGSTKKHKKEKESSLKKHKHKEKVRSPPSESPVSTDRDRYRDKDNKDRRERERRHHKKHKEKKHKQREREKPSREQDYQSDSSDCIEVPVAPPAPIITPHLSKQKSKSPSPIPENGAGDCLSIDETNKLRAKLGLKPLEVDSGSVAAGSSTTGEGQKKSVDGQPMFKDSWGEFVHKPASNLADKIEADKLREKIRQKKEKRLLEEKLKTVKTLGECEDFDDINAWIERSREKERLKAEAERRAKMLEEMDQEFGVGELVKQDIQDTRNKIYRDSHLKGLKVQHAVESFDEGKTVILTLKDQDVLDDDKEDTLINVNMIDNERYKKNVENKKQNPQTYGYDVYEEQFDQFGQPINRNILTKYDEEIDGIQRSEFKIGETFEDELNRKRKLLEIKTKLAGKRLERLDEPIIHLASDTYTEDEMAKFKKPKKKIKKLRQKLKADDLVPLVNSNSNDFRKGRGRHGRDIDNDDVPDLDDNFYDVKVEEEDNDLEQILSKARRLKQKEALISKTFEPNSFKIKEEMKKEEDEEEVDDVEMESKETNITLNATAEFCRTLGDIPTYGMSGNRDELAGDLMDFEMDTEEPDLIEDEEQSTGVWNSVNPDLETTAPDASNEMTEVAILDEEPDVGSSMGAALKLALSKGYLEKEETKRPSSTRMAYLQAKNYSIEDKAYVDDDKFQRRDRYHSGPISDFHEKDGYKPNVKLEYIDDNGRLLNEKEAFRYLSHKFHGKGPGKNKIEKRLKKSEQDGLMRKMSSTDTPLGTLTMLQHKQKETHSPYIVLSGSKQTHATTSIIKHK